MSFHYDTEELGYESAYPVVSTQSNHQTIYRGEGESPSVVYRCEVGGVGGSQLPAIQTTEPLMSTEPPAVPETRPNMTEVPETPPQAPPAIATPANANKSVGPSGPTPPAAEAPKPDAKAKLTKLQGQGHQSKASVADELRKSLLDDGYELTLDDNKTTLVATKYGEPNSSGTRTWTSELRFKNYNEFRSTKEAYANAIVDINHNSPTDREVAATSSADTTPPVTVGSLARGAGEGYPPSSGGVAMGAPPSGEIGTPPARSDVPSGGLWVGGGSAPSAYADTRGGGSSASYASVPSRSEPAQTSEVEPSSENGDKGDWSNLDSLLGTVFNNNHHADQLAKGSDRTTGLGDDILDTLQMAQKYFRPVGSSEAAFIAEQEQRLADAKTPHQKEDYLKYISQLKVQSSAYWIPHLSGKKDMTAQELWRYGQKHHLIDPKAQFKGDPNRKIEYGDIPEFVGDAALPYSEEAKNSLGKELNALGKKEPKEKQAKATPKPGVEKSETHKPETKPEAKPEAKPSTPPPGTVTV